MGSYNFFMDDEGHVRSGWRVAIFVVAFLISAQLGHVLLVAAVGITTNRSFAELAHTWWYGASGHASILLSAMFVGWACGRLLEEAPFRALGCLPERGWLKNFSIGSVIGALSLLLATGLALVSRAMHFSFDRAGASAIGKTLVVSLLIFLFAAATEEMLFRGYPLQTLARANLAWVGVVLTSTAFAAVHLGNPNVVPRMTFLNTALAGMLLAIGYLRTGGLWFPIGWHYAWNWMQGSVMGVPVSGINRIAPAPVLHAFNAGPDWLTGGAYGIEGGAACTVALLVSMVVVWRTRLVSRSGSRKKTDAA